MIEKTFVNVRDRQIARLRFRLPDVVWADTIHLVGDFNAWNRESHPFQRDRNGGWTITIELEVGRTYQFRYLRDGMEWMNDSNADAYVVNPYGSDNFVIVADPTFRKYSDQRG